MTKAPEGPKLFPSSLDHIGIKVTDYKASKQFYLKALAPLGYKLDKEYEVGPDIFACGLSEPSEKPDFWLSTGEQPTTGLHLAFTASSKAAVGKFHEEALKAGAKDNGAPGMRPQYHPMYYGAFVLDSHGNNIEAVTHTPE